MTVVVNTVSVMNGASWDLRFILKSLFKIFIDLSLVSTFWRPNVIIMKWLIQIKAKKMIWSNLFKHFKFYPEKKKNP